MVMLKTRLSQPKNHQTQMARSCETLRRDLRKRRASVPSHLRRVCGGYVLPLTPYLDCDTTVWSVYTRAQHGH
eukprot:7385300-Pyramimonas_sp.AAC.2